MFRPMRRKKQALSPQQCEQVLQNEPRGVLSVLGEDGYPYGIPMDHWYADGKLYFHGAKSGHKIDAIRACPKVSYCVCDRGTPKEGDWSLYFKSVIVFGTIRTVEEPEAIRRICTGLCRNFTQDEAYLERELRLGEKSVLCLELTPEHISGKLVHEA